MYLCFMVFNSIAEYHWAWYRESLPSSRTTLGYLFIRFNISCSKTGGLSTLAKLVLANSNKTFLIKNMSLYFFQKSQKVIFQKY